MQMFSDFVMPLAQAGGSGGSLDAALGKALGIFYKLAYLLAIVALIIGGWKFAKGDTDTGKLSIMGAAIMGLSGYIAKALFDAAGIQTNIQIQ